MVSLDSNFERRQHPRLTGNIPVKICSDDCDLVTETKNLSRTGVFCRINKHIDPMTKLKIQLLLPFKRQNKVVGIGQRFEYILVDDRLRLDVSA